MTCPDLFGRQRAAEVIDLARFQFIQNGDVVRHWFQRGWEGAYARPEDCFEPFIFTWIALNAWGACVTRQDNDPEWVQDLAQDPDMNRRFADCVADRQHPMAVAAEGFRRYWPIPRVQVWRRVEGRPDSSSVQDRARFFRNARIPCAPQCSLRHFEAEEEVPLDWRHFLPAVYRVRCNLFHGEKSPHDPVDLTIVRTSFITLVHFMRTLGHFS